MFTHELVVSSCGFSRLFSLVLLESSLFLCHPWLLLPTPGSALIGQVGVRRGCTCCSGSVLTLAVPSHVGVATPADSYPAFTSVQSKSASLMVLFKLKCSSDVGEGLLTGLDWEGRSFTGQPGVGVYTQEGGWARPAATLGRPRSLPGSLSGRSLGRCVSGRPDRMRVWAAGRTWPCEALGSSWGRERDGGDVREGNIRTGLSAEVPPQGGGRTPVPVSVLTSCGWGRSPVPLWDRHVVMQEVGPHSGPGMVFVFWGEWCPMGKQVPWARVAPTGPRPPASQAPSQHASLQPAHTCCSAAPP